MSFISIEAIRDDGESFSKMLVTINTVEIAHIQYKPAHRVDIYLPVDYPDELREEALEKGRIMDAQLIIFMKDGMRYIVNGEAAVDAHKALDKLTRDDPPPLLKS